jgi:UDPglucose 6-dehydrogenase
MRIAIVGTGYVGLVTGACLSRLGHEVTCVDVQEERVASIRNGEAPFFEPGLAELLTEGRRSGRLRATTGLAEAVAASEMTMLAVGTPSAEGSGRIDLSAIQAAARDVGTCLAGRVDRHTVVVKSTVVPGTTETVVRAALETASGLCAGRFGLAMNPEFLREGSAVSDFMAPDRIVIGQWDDPSGEATARLYASFRCPVLRVSLRNAEMIKYASNALLASLVSFSNELAGLCEAMGGADVDVVTEGLCLDGRLSPTVDGKKVRPGVLSYLRAGSGFGGSCFPKDVNALRAQAREMGVPTPLLDAVMEVNAARPGRVADLLSRELGGLRGRTVAILGLAFKPGTDDVRESPAIALAAALASSGASVRAHDPLPAASRAAAAKLRGAGVAFEAEPESLLRGADAAVLATAWPEYEAWDWARLVLLMKTRLVLDGRNVLRQVPWPADVTYVPIGTGRGGNRSAVESA